MPCGCLLLLRLANSPFHFHALLLRCRWHTLVHVIFTEAVGVHRMGRTQAAIAGDAEQEALFTRWVDADGDAYLRC